MEHGKGRCIIVGAGEFFGLPKGLEIGEDDYLIAADGGYEHLKSLGIAPKLIVGDFDSMSVPGVPGKTGDVKGLSIFEDAEKAEYIKDLRRIELDGIETRVINPVKNDPDILSCIRIAMDMGYSEFHLLGASGGRMDHSIANQQILGFLAKRGLRGYLYGESQLITAIHNESLKIPEGHRGYFSVLSLSDESRGVTERGFKYCIDDVTLNNLTPTGLSNELVGEAAELSVREGILLVIYGIELQESILAKEKQLCYNSSTEKLLGRTRLHNLNLQI